MTPELTASQREIESYLVECARDGKRYFKAKYIAEDLDMSPHSVGVNLSRLRDRTERVSVEIFGGESSGSTWLVEPSEEAKPPVGHARP